MNKLKKGYSAEDRKQFLTTLSQCIAEMDRLRGLMKEDDIKIAQSQARTWALIEEIKAMRTADEREAVRRVETTR